MDDPLTRLQIRVAQRADELARQSPSGGSARRDRETWLRAEQEYLRLLSRSVAPRTRRRKTRSA